MTCLLAIHSKCKQPCLFKRRCAYIEYQLDGEYFYLREDHNSNWLAKRIGDKTLQILSPLDDDIRAASETSDIAFFAVDLQNKEEVGDALRRGRALPARQVVSIANAQVLIDAERYIIKAASIADH